MIVDDPSQLILPITPYLVLLLLLLTVWAFRHTATRLGRWRYGTLAVLVWSMIFSAPAIGNALIGSVEGAYPTVVSPAIGSGRPLVVVLTTGSVVGDGARQRVELGASGWERLNSGVGLWRQVGGGILFVGGPSRDRKASVAAYMAAVARSWGVPEEAVRVEGQSTSTYENLLFTRRRIAANAGTAWLVTSALHMRRAMAVARKLGLRLQPYPCDQRWRPMSHWYAWLPNQGGPDLFSEAFHEIVGLIVYRLRGFAA